MKKKILALLLVVTMLVSIMPTAFAATNPDNIVVSFTGTEKTFYDDVKGIELEFMVQGQNVGCANMLASVGLKIDTTKLTIVTFDSADTITLPGKDETIASLLGDTNFGNCWGNKFGRVSNADVMGREDTDAHIQYLVLQPTFNGSVADMATATRLMAIRLAYKPGVTQANLDKNSIQLITAVEAAELGQNNVVVVPNKDGNEYQHGISSLGAGTEQLDAPAMTYPNSDKEVATPITDITLSLDKTAANVNGTTGDTITVTATKTPSNATADVALSVSGTVGAKGVTISGNTITIAKDATAGTYTVTAKGDAVTKTTTFTVTRAASSASSITLSPTSGTATLKAGGGANDVRVAATVKDQYGDTMSVTPTISGAPTGVTYSGGNLKFDATARATSGAQNITFTSGSATATFALTIKKGAAPANPTGVTGVAPTTVGGNDGSITGVTTAIEWNNNGTWTPCTGTSITGLRPGNYSLRVAGTDYTEQGNVFTVTVPDKGASPAPVITEQPKAATVYVGDAVTLEVKASGAGLSYQWYKNNTPISGATSAILNIANAAAGDAGQYKCTVTNKVGTDAPATADTTPVTVTVNEFETLTVASKNATNVNVSDIAVSDLFDVTGFAAGETIANTIGDVLTNDNGTWKDAKGVFEVTFYEKATADDGTVTYTKANAVEAGKTYIVAYKVNAVTTGIGHNQTTAVDNSAAPTEATEATYKTVAFAENAAPSRGLTVTYDAGENGTVNGSNAERVARGEKPTNVPTVTANPGFIFVGWSLDGTTVVDPTTVTINENTTFKAVYKTGVNSYIKGYDNGKFGPDDKIERAQAAAMLARLSKGFDENGKYTGTATDVKDGDWYAASVSYGLQTGLLKGYENGAYGPKDNMTRAQFASLLARYLGVKSENKPSFKDIENTNSVWALYDIAALEELGIVEGYEDGGFHPEDDLTRAQAVKMINVALKLQSADGEQYPVEAPTDVSTGHWAYDYIMKALSTDIETLKR